MSLCADTQIERYTGKFKVPQDCLLGTLLFSTLLLPLGHITLIQHKTCVHCLLSDLETQDKAQRHLTNALK